MDHAAFQTWLDRYIAAWRSGDPGEIGSLFSADAQYYYGPYREPVVGRDAIVADWTIDPDAAGSWEAEYRPLAIDGDVAVATASRATRVRARPTATSSSAGSTPTAAAPSSGSGSCSTHGTRSADSALAPVARCS